MNWTINKYQITRLKLKKKFPKHNKVNDYPEKMNTVAFGS